MSREDIRRIKIHARWFFIPRAGLGTPDEYKNHLDGLDLSGIMMHPYRDHHQVCPFERVSLYTR
jgi:hypothetical protein